LLVFSDVSNYYNFHIILSFAQSCYTTSYQKTLAKVQYLFEISKCAINTTMPIVEGKR